MKYKKFLDENKNKMLAEMINFINDGSELISFIIKSEVFTLSSTCSDYEVYVNERHNSLELNAEGTEFSFDLSKCNIQQKNDFNEITYILEQGNSRLVLHKL